MSQERPDLGELRRSLLTTPEDGIDKRTLINEVAVEHEVPAAVVVNELEELIRRGNVYEVERDDGTEVRRT